MLLTKERKTSILREAYEENKTFHENISFDEFLEYYNERKSFSTMESLENYIRLRIKKRKEREDAERFDDMFDYHLHYSD